MRKDRKNRLEKGLCYDCKGVAEVGIYCLRCWFKKSLRNKNYYQNHKDRIGSNRRQREHFYRSCNRCPHCGAPLMGEEKTYCVNCIDRIHIGVS